MRLSVPAVLALAAGGADAQGLHALAKAAGKQYLGTALGLSDFNDAAYMAILEAETGQVTPGNEQKWFVTEPQRGVFKYDDGDKIINWAKQRGDITHCHAAAWHQALPDWMTSTTYSASEMTQILQTHIANVVGHFKGRCDIWDVLNEALDYKGDILDDLFYQALGTDYIPLVFKAVAAADPSTKLYYNEFFIDTLCPKQEGVLKIIKLVQDAGARIDGVGVQGHFTSTEVPTQSELEAALNSYIQAGVTEVAYTEFDMGIKQPLPASEAALQQQAIDYATVIKACLAVKECAGWTIWGFTDKYSWIPGTTHGQKGDACLYDDNLQRKPAYYAVANALKAAAGGGGKQ